MMRDITVLKSVLVQQDFSTSLFLFKLKQDLSWHIFPSPQVAEHSDHMDQGPAPKVSQSPKIHDLVCLYKVCSLNLLGQGTPPFFAGWQSRILSLVPCSGGQ